MANHPFGYSLEEMDVEAFLNMRDWLQKSCEAQGGKMVGGGVGMGQADIDIELEGCRYNISIKPLPRSPQESEPPGERAMTTGYEQPGDPAFEGGAAFERYQEEQEKYRNDVIEQCVQAALCVPMPRYGTNARFTGRAEMQGWIVKAIRRLKGTVSAVSTPGDQK